MPKSKISKFLSYLILIVTISTGFFYWQLPTRHKAIIKTTFLQKSGIVDNKWIIDKSHLQYKVNSPTFYIDGIYKSMEGPKSSKYIQLSQDTTMLWITGFHVKALDSKTEKQISNDFICHTNIDFNDVKYYSNFNLQNRIGIQYPRLISLSHGIENFTFPKGFGIPMKGTDLLYLTTQSLNHNIPDANYLIKHQVTIDYSKTNTQIKPLLSKTVFIMLPYNRADPYKSPIDPGKDFCIPIETKNHNYEDKEGNMLSGHWKIPIGKKTYRSSIDNQLQIKDSLKLHAGVVHVHPFATSITLFDKTVHSTVFVSNITNHKNKIGLAQVEGFSSEKGIWLYKNHSYELILESNNTSTTSQDMMGSMFLFFYDKQLEENILKTK